MGLCQDTAKITGQRLLFCGANAANWSASQFVAAAQFARRHGIDSLLVKSGGDAGQLWYGGVDGIAAISKEIKAQGVGFIPYYFSNGSAVSADISMAITLMKTFGVVCADLEDAWNGQVGWAQQMCAALKPVPGTLLITTWGDPNEQSWRSVIEALNPCVNVWVPQAYDDYLASTTWVEFASDGAQCIFPAVDLSNEFGANHPATIAATAHSRGDAAIVIWYYDLAAANPTLLDQVLAAFPEGVQPVTAPAQNAYQSNANVKKNLDDYWNSSASSLPDQKPAPMGTGIHGAWVNAALAGHFMGAPLSLEYPSSDWNGSSITCQNFPGGKCEWRNGTPSWYGPNGPMNII